MRVRWSWFKVIQRCHCISNALGMRKTLVSGKLFAVIILTFTTEYEAERSVVAMDNIGPEAGMMEQAKQNFARQWLVH